MVPGQSQLERAILIGLPLSRAPHDRRLDHPLFLRKCFKNDKRFQLTRLYPRLPRVPVHCDLFLGRRELLGPRRAGDAALAAREPVPGLLSVDGVALRSRESPR